jgi:hypothetical protein
MEYVLLTWKTAEGRRRRSFAVKPGAAEACRRTVGYCLVTNDGDGRNETLVAFTADSSVTVSPARWNNFYGWLERAAR